MIFPPQKENCREKRNRKANSRYNVDTPLIGKARKMKNVESMASTGSVPIADPVGETKGSKNLETVSSAPKSSGATKIVQTKGRRCTMQEYRTAIMKQKNKELHYEIDCSEMAEENSVDMNEFVSKKLRTTNFVMFTLCTRQFQEDFVRQKMKADSVVLAQHEWKITITVRSFIKKSAVKQIIKHFLSKKKINQFVHVVADSKISFQLQYYRLPM